MMPIVHRIGIPRRKPSTSRITPKMIIIGLLS
jgi:hypothetical protein